MANTEDREQRAAAELKAEYLAACEQPLLATVSIPHDATPSRRLDLLSVFCDGLGERQNRELCATAISVLLRDPEGKKVLEKLAQQHGDYFADVVVLTCDLEPS